MYEILAIMLVNLAKICYFCKDKRDFYLYIHKFRITKKMITNGFSCAARTMTITTTAVQPMFYDEVRQVFFDLRWMLALIVCLILADFWFGVSDSLYNKEHFRFSRAGRRTCNKFCDYICYLMIGTFLGLAIFEPLGITNHIVTAAIGIGFGCLWEIDSVVGHVCSLHGVNNRFSVKKFIISLIKKKDEDLGEAVEDGFNNENSKGNGKS